MKKIRSILPIGLLVIAGIMILPGCGSDSSNTPQMLVEPSPTSEGFYTDVSNRVNEGACEGSRVAYTVPINNEWDSGSETVGLMVTCKNGETEWWERQSAKLKQTLDNF